MLLIKDVPFFFFFPTKSFSFPLKKKKKTEKTQFWKYKAKHSIQSAALTQLTLYTKQ